MAQQSSIDRLPEAAREQLNALLRDPAITQKDAVSRINTILAELQHPERLSKSAVNRYDLKMRDVGQRLQQSRDLADMWIAKLGAAPQGKVGNLVNEILRTLSFDLSLKAADLNVDDIDELPAVAGMLKDLALNSMRLEKAANLNVEREKEIRQQALIDAAQKVDKVAKQAGITPDTIKKIHEALF